MTDQRPPSEYVYSHNYSNDDEPGEVDASQDGDLDNSSQIHQERRRPSRTDHQPATQPISQTAGAQQSADEDDSELFSSAFSNSVCLAMAANNQGEEEEEEEDGD